MKETYTGSANQGKADPNKNIFVSNSMTWTLIGGGFAAVFSLLSLIVVGQVYGDFEARRLISAMAPSVRTLCFAAITATSTILTLMLTMLGLIRQTDIDFSPRFYGRIQRIGMLSTGVLIVAVLQLSVMSIPLEQAENLKSTWLHIVYYLLVVATASISGGLVAIILILFDTVRSVIQIMKDSVING